MRIADKFELLELERFKLAIRNNDTATLEKLILDGIDINSDMRCVCTPLEYAIKEGSLESAIFLIKRGGKVFKPNPCVLDPTYGMCNTLQCAVVYKNHNFLKWLLENRQDVNALRKGGNTLLHYATTREVAEILIAKGLSVDTKSIYDVTPLEKAAFEGHASVVETLIRHGADVNLTNNKGETPLHRVMVSFAADRQLIAKLLLANGANVNSRTNCGFTLLHRVEAYRDEAMIVKEILAYDIDIDARSIAEGKTALHYAICLPDLIQMYLTRGANINVESNEGFSPLSAACRYIQQTVEPESYITRAQLSVEYLVRHILKLQAIGLYVSENNLKLANSIRRQHNELWCQELNERLEHFDKDCVKELNKLKTNLGISVKYFLSGKYRYPRYISNEELCRKLEMVEKKSYPIYGEMIGDKFRRDKIRFSLIEPCKASLILSRMNPTPPEVIWEQILSHLADVDLKFFSKPVA